MSARTGQLALVSSGGVTFSGQGSARHRPVAFTGVLPSATAAKARVMSISGIGVVPSAIAG